MLRSNPFCIRTHPCFPLAAAGLILLMSLLQTGCDAFAPPEADVQPALRQVAEAPVFSVTAATDHCTSGRQSSGALFEVCRPEAFNGTLVIYAHGFVFPQMPLHIREQEGGIAVKDFITSRGFAYAATSYYTNGVVEPERGAKDIRELIAIYTQRYERPERVLLMSFSNGTLLSMLALEKEAELFDGALASCGPHGSYLEEIQYLGDVFVLFDFFFRDVEVIPGFGTGMPGGPDGIPQALIDGLAAMAPSGYTAVDVLAQLVLTALQNNPVKTQQLLGTIQYTSALSRGSVLFASAPEGVELVIRTVAYNIFATNDALEKLGGRFFDNSTRIYGDLLPDEALRQALNAAVTRYEADEKVTAQLESRYESTGHLRTPVVALHNTRDPLIPFWQEPLYLEDLGPRASNYTLVPVERYGHCNFTQEEIARGLDTLLEQIAGQAEPVL